MPRASLLLLPALLIGLAACDSGGPSDGTDTTGVWSGTAEFAIDSVFADQNLYILADYETRYEFTLEENENGLVYGFLNQYNTGTMTVEEARPVAGAPSVRDIEFAWDETLVQSWPVYGTYEWPVLELDLPEAEEAEVFPEDLWTFDVVGSRARLAGTRILHGYGFSIYENGGTVERVTLQPVKADEFTMRLQ